jgi:hypothetical protein
VLPALNLLQFTNVLKFQKHHVLSLGATLDDFFSNEFLANGSLERYASFRVSSFFIYFKYLIIVILSLRKKRKLAKCHKQQTRGLMVAFGHIHWELIQHIMLGIHLSLQSAYGSSSDPLIL